MRAIGHSLLGVTLAATTATAAFAQQNPGLSVQPSGRTLAAPEATPMEKPVDLLRPTRVQSTNETSPMDDLLYAPGIQDSPWAQTKLAQEYIDAAKDDISLQQGVYLLRQAAEQNYPEALFLMGSLTMAGHGVPQSTEAAFDYCRRAAELGHAPAQYELAAMYALGRGTQMDTNKALEWARKAMDQGNTKSKYSVGRLLLVRETQADQAEALELLGQAIDSGIDEAGMFLAEAYTAGRHGLPKNKTKSMAILEKLSARGNTEAAEVLGRLRSTAE